MSPKLRILFLIDNLDPGGAQTHLVDFASHLDVDRFEPMVCSLRLPQAFLSDFEKAGIPVTHLGKGRLNPFKLWKLVSLIRKEKVDIIHTHLAASQILGTIAGKLAGVAKIFVHDHSGDDYLRQSPLVARFFLYPLERVLIRYVDRVFSVSRTVRDFCIDVKHFPPEKVEVLYNWIDAGKFAPRMEDRRRLRSEWHIPADALVIGSVGRLHPTKGYRHLIQAAPLILQKHPRVRFVIVGEGPERDVLERLAKAVGVGGEFLFPGFMADIQCAYSAFDVFVLPSLKECFPISLLEAMAAGIPVVATEVGGVPEMIENGKNGFLVPVANPELLATTISSLIAESETRKQIRDTAKIWAEKRFSREQAMGRVEVCYSEGMADPLRGGIRKNEN